MKCGDYGPEKYRYHSELGNPVIDGGKFPDLSHLTDLAHSLNLTAGWYEFQKKCQNFWILY